MRVAAAAVDRARRAEILVDMKAMRGDLKGRGREHHLHRLDAAILILEVFERAEEFADAEASRVLTRLVASIPDEPEVEEASVPLDDEEDEATPGPMCSQATSDW